MTAAKNHPDTQPILLDLSNTNELTAAETALRVAAIERFREHERQMWESLTPEEQVEHDRQFEGLYKSLKESRT